MNIKIEGQNLLDFHSNLYKRLIKIPEQREINYREEIIDDKRIGKPRFKIPLYIWSTELLTDVHNHLQNIWNFFEKYSFWFDNTILSLITQENRRISKKSIIFLLENDVWCTDEVYGDYFIEKNQIGTTISYFRRERKIREYKLKTTDDQKIKEWICNDVIKQIKNQFVFLWSKLENEIKVCINEKFHKEPRFILKANYLKEQLDKIKSISESWPEAALLSLGRISEFWLLKILGKKNSPFLTDIIRTSEIDGIISRNDGKLLRKIKKHYNDLKHKTYYRIDEKLISDLIEEFSSIFLTKN